MAKKDFNNIQKSYLFSFLHRLYFFGALTVPFFLDWAKIDYTRIFILQAWFSFWVFALEIPTGVVADKWGRKHSLALGSLCGAAGFIVYGLVNNYAVFFVSEFLLALGAALISGADKALLYDSLIELKKTKEAKHHFSRYEMAATIGTVLSLPVGSIMAGSGIIPYPQSLPIAVLLTSLSGLGGLAVALSMREPRRKKPTENPLRLGIEGFKLIFKNSYLRAFSLNFALISSATFFMFWLYQPLAQAAGLGIAYYGIIAAGYNIFSILLLRNLKWLEARLKMQRILLLSALLPGLLYFAAVVSKSILVVLPAIFIVAGSRIMRGPILSDYLNRQIVSKNRATVLSGVTMLERVAITILYPVVGLLADKSINYALIFLAAVTLIFTFATRISDKHF